MYKNLSYRESFLYFFQYLCQINMQVLDTASSFCLANISSGFGTIALFFLSQKQRNTTATNTDIIVTEIDKVVVLNPNQGVAELYHLVWVAMLVSCINLLSRITKCLAERQNQHVENTILLERFDNNKKYFKCSRSI